MPKVKTHLALAPAVRTNLKILAVQHGIAPGDAVAGLLLLAKTCPLLLVTRAMAAQDERAGELVPTGETPFMDRAYEGEAIANAHAEHMSMAWGEEY